MFLPRESRPRFKATRNFLPPPRGRKRYFVQKNLPQLSYSVLQNYNITPYKNERMINIYCVYRRHKNSNDDLRITIYVNRIKTYKPPSQNFVFETASSTVRDAPEYRLYSNPKKMAKFRKQKRKEKSSFELHKSRYISEKTVTSEAVS